MQIIEEDINVIKQKKTFLEILIDVFELTMHSSTVDLIKAQIQKNLDEDLKDYEDIPFISIKDPLVAINESQKETFYESIMKDLKYLLIHNKEDFALKTSRNAVIYLLSKILNLLIKMDSKLVKQKEINHIYITNTSSLMGGQSENEQTLISFLFHLSEHYTEQLLKILQRDYSELIKKEKEQEINDAYYILPYSLKVLLETFTKNNNEKCLLTHRASKSLFSF